MVLIRDAICHIMLFIPFIEVLPLVRISKLWAEAFSQYEQTKKVIIFPKYFGIETLLKWREETPIIKTLKKQRISKIVTETTGLWYLAEPHLPDIIIETPKTTAKFKDHKLYYLDCNQGFNLQDLILDNYDPDAEIHIKVHDIYYRYIHRPILLKLRERNFKIVLKMENSRVLITHITTNYEKYTAPVYDLKTNIVYIYRKDYPFQHCKNVIFRD